MKLRSAAGVVRPLHRCRRRHRIGTRATPGMATADPFQTQPWSAADAVHLTRLQEICRAAWHIAAPRAGSTQRQQNGPECQLITSNDEANESEHQASRSNRRAAFAKWRHSSRRLANDALAAAARATRVNQTPGCRFGLSARTISLSRLRTRLRSTAPPTRREVTKPTRDPSSSATCSTVRTMNPPWTERPSARTRAYSPLRTSRAARGKRSRDIGAG